jgi:hypothetical protein
MVWDGDVLTIDMTVGTSPYNGRVMWEDRDISQYLYGVEVKAFVGSLTEVTLYARMKTVVITAVPPQCTMPLEYMGQTRLPFDGDYDYV